MPFLPVLLLACLAADGDTLRCGKDRYRLLGIDAPEMGHCRKGRTCVPGDPLSSKAGLAKLIRGRQVRLEIVGRDRYERGLVLASVGGIDLSCAQIRAGRAAYIAKWDNGRRVARMCPDQVGKRSR